MYTVKALNYLLNAGWIEGRNVDIKDFESWWDQYNLSGFESAKAFMREFGGLYIEFFNHKRGLPDNMLLDVEEALAVDFPEKIDPVYAARIGRNVVPIGAAFHYSMVLLIHEYGMVYAAYDTYIIKLGRAPYDFFNFVLDLPKDVKFEEVR